MRSSSPRVLVVSKDPLFVDPVRVALKEAGLDVANAGTRSAALREIEKAHHAVVLLDADALGGEAARIAFKVRRRDSSARVFVAATDPRTAFLIELIDAGIHCFVPKPLNPEKTSQLARVIARDRRRTSAPTAATQRPAGALRRGDRPLTSGGTSSVAPGVPRAEIDFQQRVSQLTVLYQMGRDISQNENWSDALDRFLMALVKYSRADGAALLLFNRNGDRLGSRSNFQVDEAALTGACETLGTRWRDNPRGLEIHSVEGYDDRVSKTCLERVKPWRLTVVPLRYRSCVWGFLLIEKPFRSNGQFRLDYPFLTTIQTILAEEVANASYISDLRQLSRFNQKVLDNIQSGVVTTDLDGRVVFWNHLAQEMCPTLTRRSRVHFDELFRSPAHAAGLFRTIMGSREDTHVFEVSYGVEPAGESPGRLSISKMHDDNLNGTVLVGIIEDLTEQKRLEAEIRRTDRLRVLGQLSAGVAHEIRNPLTGIATSAEVLARRLGESEDKLKYVRAILDETSRLDGIVRDLLSFARPVKPRIDVCRLSEVSARAVSLLGDQAAKKGVDLRIRGDLDDDVCMADANQLTQVLLNLVLNSLEACGRGNTVEIVLSGERDPTKLDEAFARIDVLDDGEGVPPEVRGRLFEPFVTTKTHGTGLGLAISQQIIEEHRGQIRCEFMEKGTRFTIRLPHTKRGATRCRG